MTDRDLINAATKAMENAYAPYSKFGVGAALECEDGTVYTGCNIENSSFGCTVCAERTALYKAVSEGQRKFKRIAIYSNSKSYCVPCGICRQVLAEFAPDMEVLCVRWDGHYTSYPLSRLLPAAFSKDFL